MNDRFVNIDACDWNETTGGGGGRRGCGIL
jgi:hypothetical protein